MANPFDFVDAPSVAPHQASGGMSANPFDFVDTPPSPPPAPNLWQHPATQVAMSTAGGMGGSVAGGTVGALIGGAVEPLGGEIPGAMIGSRIGGGLGMGGMEALREHLSGLGLKPGTIAWNTVAGALFPHFFGNAQNIVKTAAPLTSRLLPSLAREGSVLNTAVRGGMAAMPMAFAHGAATAPADTTLLGRAQAGVQEAEQSFGPSAVTAGAMQTVPNLISTYRGTPAAEAKAAIPTMADVQTLAYRRGGSAETPGRAFLRSEAEKAWAPMKEVSTSIDDAVQRGEMSPITENQLYQLTETRFPDDPVRAQATKDALSKIIAKTKPSNITPALNARTFAESEQELTRRLQQVEQEQLVGKHLSAEQLVNMSSKLGESIARPAFTKGTASIPGSDLAFSDARSVIADMLEAKSTASSAIPIPEAGTSSLNTTEKAIALGKQLAGRQDALDELQVRMDAMHEASTKAREFGDPQEAMNFAFKRQMYREAKETAETEPSPSSEVSSKVQQAKQQWEDYASGLREPFYKYFQPGRSPEASTNAGVDFLTRVAKGEATPSDMRFLKKLEQGTGQEIVKPLQEAGNRATSAAKRTQLVRSMTRRVGYIFGPIGLAGYMFRRAIFQAVRGTGRRRR